MKKYTKEELESLYDTNINELAKMFKKAEYTDEKIIKIFNSNSKDIVIKLALNLNFRETKKQNYHIPDKYNVPEAEFLKDDRDEMYKQMDYDIPFKIGKQLQILYDYDNENYSIFIHRTCNFDEKIFEQGIEYGVNNTPYVHDHFQKFDNFPFMLREIKYCSSYKGSTGCVIAKIPKRGFDKNYIDNPIPIYYKSQNGKTYLRPEFICCYVPVINEELQDIKFRENSIYYSPNTEFYCDESVSNDKKMSA